MRKKNTNEYNYIITDNQEFIQYPFTYGIFATLDNHYRTLSSTIKVNFFNYVFIENKLILLYKIV